jgi:hypothetical protein
MRLTLTIAADAYTLRRLADDGGWLLTKAGGDRAAHAVTWDTHGPRCSCPSARHRIGPCKHSRSLMAHGLI